MPPEMQAFELSDGNKVDGPSTLSARGRSIHVFQRKKLHLDSCDHRTALLQIILNDFCPREDDSVSCTASSLHDRALSVDCMVKCVHRERFLELFVSPRSDFHDTIISVFNAVLPEGPKVTGI